VTFRTLYFVLVGVTVQGFSGVNARSGDPYSSSQVVLHFIVNVSPWVMPNQLSNIRCQCSQKRRDQKAPARDESSADGKKKLTLTTAMSTRKRCREHGTGDMNPLIQRSDVALQKAWARKGRRLLQLRSNVTVTVIPPCLCVVDVVVALKNHLKQRSVAASSTHMMDQQRRSRTEHKRQ